MAGVEEEEEEVVVQDLGLDMDQGMALEVVPDMVRKLRGMVAEEEEAEEAVVEEVVVVEEVEAVE